MKKDKILFFVALGGYLAHILIFILSLFVFSMKDFVLLLSFASFIYIVFIHTEMNGDKPIWSLRKSKYKYESHFQQITGMHRILVCVTLVISFITFVSGAVITWEGCGRIVDGVYWLQDHGDLIRQISREEYVRLVFAEIRIVPAVMLSFAVAPVVHYGEKIKDYYCKQQDE